MEHFFSISLAGNSVKSSNKVVVSFKSETVIFGVVGEEQDVEAIASWFCCCWLLVVLWLFELVSSSCDWSIGIIEELEDDEELYVMGLWGWGAVLSVVFADVAAVVKSISFVKMLELFKNLYSGRCCWLIWYCFIFSEIFFSKLRAISLFWYFCLALLSFSISKKLIRTKYQKSERTQVK